jgi:hypothetical protein
MSQVYQEFCDQNLHRAYPLTDESGALDVTNSFTIPSSLIADIYLCAPKIPQLDITKFYIQNVLIRQFFIDITIGYDDPQTPDPIGVFKNISSQAALCQTYDFTPFELQTNNDFTPLYHMTGQITIGDPLPALSLLGSWNFNPIDNEHATYITPTRVARGLLNVQYVSVNDRLFTGVVKFREGSNITIDVDTRTVDGVEETVLTINSTLNASSDLQLSNDQDVLNALIQEFGQPLLSINGMLPAPGTRNFNFFGLDCTSIEAADNGLVMSNPCASPCCDEDANITNIMDSIANLNLRYSQLSAYFEAQAAAIQDQQNKLLVLGSEV